MEHNGTKKRWIKIAAMMERPLVRLLDSEVKQKRCSRADILRWAVMDRYGLNTHRAPMEQKDVATKAH